MSFMKTVTVRAFTSGEKPGSKDYLRADIRSGGGLPVRGTPTFSSNVFRLIDNSRNEPLVRTATFNGDCLRYTRGGLGWRKGRWEAPIIQTLTCEGAPGQRWSIAGRPSRSG